MNILSVLNPHLKYPPVKYVPKPMPDYLIHRSVVRYYDYPIDNYTMFSTKKSEAGARTVMRCIPEHIERDVKLFLLFTLLFYSQEYLVWEWGLKC